MNYLSIWSKLNEWSESFKEFMLNHDQNLFVYTGFFLIGIAIFAIAFSALNNDK